MRSKNIRRGKYYLVPIILAASFSGLDVEAQPKWRTYTAPDKSFSVEVPWKPFYSRRNTSGMQGGPGGAVAFRGTTSVDIYDLSMYTNEPNTSFIIRVYTLSAEDTEKEFDLEGKLAPIASGSQKPDLWQESAITINGLRGREVIYQNGKLGSRLLMVFAKHRIYQVAFITESEKGISRGPVDRVFGSFQPKP